jgi:rhodanese-related sulfurtransferase
VERRRVRGEVRYRLADPLVIRLWQAIRAVGEARLAEVRLLVQLYLADRGRLEAIDLDTLRQRLAKEAVIVVDVRPEPEYRNGHLPGARSIPLAELRARLRELPTDGPIVAYCRGPYCVMADEAVALLTAHGYRAARLEGGFPDWQAAGLPVEREAND